MGDEWLDVVFVDDIPNTVSGKYRYTICKGVHRMGNLNNKSQFFSSYAEAVPSV